MPPSWTSSCSHTNIRSRRSPFYRALSDTTCGCQVPESRPAEPRTLRLTLRKHFCCFMRCLAPCCSDACPQHVHKNHTRSGIVNAPVLSRIWRSSCANAHGWQQQCAQQSAQQHETVTAHDLSLVVHAVAGWHLSDKRQHSS
jgi:hypothetical protein